MSDLPEEERVLMKVHELINQLFKCDGDAEIKIESSCGEYSPQSIGRVVYEDRDGWNGYVIDVYED